MRSISGWQPGCHAAPQLPEVWSVATKLPSGDLTGSRNLTMGFISAGNQVASKGGR